MHIEFLKAYCIATPNPKAKSLLSNNIISNFLNAEKKTEKLN